MTAADVRGRSLAARLWSRTLDTVFPPRCVSCGAFGIFVCETCTPKTATAEHPRCGVCWQPSAETRCWECTHYKPAFTAVRSVYVFVGPARDLVHALKFDGLSAVAPLMASAMVERFQEWAPEVDAIVPVPMAGTRRRRRGYNQSELLARGISRVTSVRVESSAIVRRPGLSQIEQPDEDARRRNAIEAFAPGRAKVSGAVLLVDDVMTTGATLDACARVLKSAGTERVYGLAFARES